MVLSCVNAGDLSSLLELSFGYNLVLPILKEFVVIKKYRTEKSLDLLFSFMKIREFDNDARSAIILELNSVKREMILIDDKLRVYVNMCTISALCIAIFSLIMVLIVPYIAVCIGIYQATLCFSVLFIPLPFFLFVLDRIGGKHYGALSQRLEIVNHRLMQG